MRVRKAESRGVVPMQHGDVLAMLPREQGVLVGGNWQGTSKLSNSRSKRCGEAAQRAL